MALRYIFFDVSQTLLYKPKVEENYFKIVQEINPEITLTSFQKAHKALSDVYTFPDRTSENFYRNFNSQLLSLLAIEPSESLLESIFFACKNLAWETYDDLFFIENISLPMGIITNFSHKVRPLLKDKIAIDFHPIIISEEAGMQKPHPQIFQKAIEESGVSPEEILYIGDSFHLDYLPAQKLGMNAIIIDRIGFYPNSSFIINHLNEIENRL